MWLSDNEVIGETDAYAGQVKGISDSRKGNGKGYSRNDITESRCGKGNYQESGKEINMTESECGNGSYQESGKEMDMTELECGKGSYQESGKEMDMTELECGKGSYQESGKEMDMTESECGKGSYQESGKEMDIPESESGKGSYQESGKEMDMTESECGKGSYQESGKEMDMTEPGSYQCCLRIDCDSKLTGQMVEDSTNSNSLNVHGVVIDMQELELTRDNGEITVTTNHDVVNSENHHLRTYNSSPDLSSSASDELLVKHWSDKTDKNREVNGNECLLPACDRKSELCIPDQRESRIQEKCVRDSFLVSGNHGNVTGSEVKAVIVDLGHANITDNCKAASLDGRLSELPDTVPTAKKTKLDSQMYPFREKSKNRPKKNALKYILNGRVTTSKRKSNLNHISKVKECKKKCKKSELKESASKSKNAVISMCTNVKPRQSVTMTTGVCTEPGFAETTIESGSPLSINLKRQKMTGTKKPRKGAHKMPKLRKNNSSCDTCLGKQDTGLGKCDAGLGKQDVGLGKQDTGLGKCDVGLGRCDTGLKKHVTDFGGRSVRVRLDEKRKEMLCGTKKTLTGTVKECVKDGSTSKKLFPSALKTGLIVSEKSLCYGKYHRKREFWIRKDLNAGKTDVKGARKSVGAHHAKEYLDCLRMNKPVKMDADEDGGKVRSDELELDKLVDDDTYDDMQTEVATKRGHWMGFMPTPTTVKLMEKKTKQIMTMKCPTEADNKPMSESGNDLYSFNDKLDDQCTHITEQKIKYRRMGSPRELQTDKMDNNTDKADSNDHHGGVKDENNRKEKDSQKDSQERIDETCIDHANLDDVKNTGKTICSGYRMNLDRSSSKDIKDSKRTYNKRNSVKVVCTKNGVRKISKRYPCRYCGELFSLSYVSFHEHKHGTGGQQEVYCRRKKVAEIIKPDEQAGNVIAF